jgi:CheY-like chemotaxis protein
VDAHTILRDAITAIRVDAAEKQIELNLKLKAKQRQMRGDAVRLQQVFWNVLKNAVKFTPPGGKITVETFVAADGEQLNVKITDTGIGMTGEELTRIFTAFSQGDHAVASSHRFGGLGLGLAISRQIVEQHSGHIHAVSEGRNKGSIFTIELPVAKMKNKDSPPVKIAPKNISFAQEAKNAGARILLVEDHEPTRNALTILLLRRHYKIFAAGSLAEARKIVGKEKIDFVISDIGLPDGNGNDLMKDLGERYGLKGIALTGYGMEQDVERSLAAGFVTHLTKPVHVQSLEKALSAAL